MPSIQRLGGADQHRLRVAKFAGDDVQHVVHAVDQIDVGVTAASEHNLGSRCAPLGCVTRQIVRPDVCLGFYNAGTQKSVISSTNENLADQRLGQSFGAGIIK